MKKGIACLLVLSVILGIAGCKSVTEETTKETEVPTSTETSATETEPSESETETQTTVSEETSTTWETFETEPPYNGTALDVYPLLEEPSEPKGLGNVSFKRNLKNLDIETSAVSDWYKEAGWDYNRMEMICESLRIKTSGYEKLNDELDAIFAPLEEKAKTQYSEEKEICLKQLAEKKGDYYERLNDWRTLLYIGVETKVLRADDYIVSFMTEETWRENSDLIKGYNFRSKDATPITFDDVVKDRAALCSYYLTTFDYEYLDDDSKESMDEILGQIMDGTVAFALSYDGICLSNCTGWSAPVHLSAMKHPEIFDLSYFGNTPKYYMILMQEDTVFWDVTGDGQADVLSFDIEREEGYSWAETISVTINGKKSADIDLKESEVWYDDAYLARTDTGMYLIINLSDEYNGVYIEVYKIKDDLTLEKVSSDAGSFTESISAEGNTYDPSDILIYDPSNAGAIGSAPYYNFYTMIGENGGFKAKDDLYRKTAYLVTEEEFSCTIIKKDGTVVKDFKVPVGTAVREIGFSKKDLYAKLETLETDESESYIISLPVQKYDEGNWYILEEPYHHGLFEGVTLYG
ncbi:MAG: hypothetical protein IKX04_04385 [Clostridiales bacterium]|nr:hypothetical protein [Clostridiales bacterium]MBR5057784.1 hypothetical protein [Clostridiales bacterium]